MKKYPTLFKKTNTGAVQQWTICVTDATMTTVHGQVGGALQSTSDTIVEGKNEGRANATTPAEQAIKEAEAKWLRQKKKRYVETIEEAQTGAVDEEIILGGIAPMLAPSAIWSDTDSTKDRLKFPVGVQPKLDGARCIAVLENGVCTLWSRTQKRILSLPHIERAVEAHFGSLTEYKKTRLILDGEAYNHDLHDQFEELMSAFRKDKPSAESAMLEYHIYDVVPNKSYLFSDRNEWLSEVLPTRDGVLVPVRTVVCHSNEEIWDAHAQNVTEGYEGSMIRVDGPYECGKRSAYLRKLKAFQDAEYKIVGAVEGRGKDAGTIGSFVCVTPEGREFGCRLKSTYARRAELFLNPKEWKDQLLTVKYQNLTADGIPRFPIGKALREGA